MHYVFSSCYCILLEMTSVFPASHLRFGANLPRLEVPHVNLASPPWLAGVMTRKNRTLTPAVQLFVDCAREVVNPIARKPNVSRRATKSDASFALTQDRNTIVKIVTPPSL